MDQDNIFTALVASALLAVALLFVAANMHYNSLKFKCLTERVNIETECR